MTAPLGDSDSFAVQELQRLRDEGKQLESKLAGSKAEIQTLKVELHRRGKALTVVEEKLASSQNKVLSLEAEVKSVKSAASQAQAELAAAKAEARSANAEADRLNGLLVAKGTLASPSPATGEGAATIKLQSALDTARAEIGQLRAEVAASKAAMSARDKKLAAQVQDLVRLEELSLRAKQLENDKAALRREATSAAEEIATLQKMLRLQEGGVEESMAQAARRQGEAAQQAAYLHAVRAELDATKRALDESRARALDLETSPRKKSNVPTLALEGPSSGAKAGEIQVPQAVHDATVNQLQAEIKTLRNTVAEKSELLDKATEAAAAAAARAASNNNEHSRWSGGGPPVDVCAAVETSLQQALASLSPAPQTSMVAAMAGFGPDTRSSSVSNRKHGETESVLRSALSTLRDWRENSIAGVKSGEAALTVAKAQTIELHRQVEELSAALVAAQREADQRVLGEESDDGSPAAPQTVAAIEAATARQRNAAAARGSLWLGVGGRRSSEGGSSFSSVAMTPDRLADILERLMEARAGRLAGDPRAVHDEASRLLNAELARLGQELVAGMADAERLRGEVKALESARLSARATAARLDELNAMSMKVGALQLEVTELVGREAVLLAEIRRLQKKRSFRSRLQRAFGFEGRGGSTEQQPKEVKPQQKRALLGRLGLHDRA